MVLTLMHISKPNDITANGLFYLTPSVPCALDYILVRFMLSLALFLTSMVLIFWFIEFQWLDKAEKISNYCNEWS